MLDARTEENRLDNSSLVDYSRKGDVEAFNQLVFVYQDAAYNLAYRILGEKTSAEDAVQDGFISAYLKLNSFRGGSFKAWLFRIVINNCIDEIRRQNRRPTVPIYPTDEYDEEIESPHWLEDPNVTPEEALMQDEFCFTIQKGLNALQTDFRIVVVLVDILEMSYAEAAKVTGVPVGTIKSRLRRARLGLQTYLNENFEFIPVCVATNFDKLHHTTKEICVSVENTG